MWCNQKFISGADWYMLSGAPWIRKFGLLASKKFWFGQNRLSICMYILTPAPLCLQMWNVSITGLRDQGICKLCLTWYWTSVLKSIHSCQNREPSDHFHMTVSQAHFYNSLRWHIFLSSPLTRYGQYSSMTGSENFTWLLALAKSIHYPNILKGR